MDTEEDGEIFMKDIRNLVVEGDLLEAKWSSKSFPSTPGEGSQVINITTGEIQQWHPLKGVKAPTRQMGSRSTTPTPGPASSPGSSRWPQGVQQGCPTSGVSIAYAPSIPDCLTAQAGTSSDHRQDSPLVGQDGVARARWTRAQGDQMSGSQVQQRIQEHQDERVNTHTSEHGTDHGLQLVPGGPRNEPWRPQDRVQAVLLDDDHILLTIYNASDDTWIHSCKVQRPQHGTIWDYQSRNPGHVWLAKAQDATAGVVQEWIYSVRQDTWIGTPYVVTSPENIQVHKATHTCHNAFLQLRRGQHITAISPPIWVWADHTRLAGLWCIAATTYNWDPEDYIHMSSNVRAGLVPISVVTKAKDL